MTRLKISRRKFVSTATVAAIGSSAFGLDLNGCKSINAKPLKEVVSIVRIKDGNIAKAVEEAIDLLGGINTVTTGKSKIMLKPNLVTSSTDCTTKLYVVKTLAQLMQKA